MSTPDIPVAQPSLATPTTRVYTTYRTPASPYEGELPPHPGPSWTRFVCISDTHSFTDDLFKDQIPPGDFLLHSGDLSSWGKPKQLQKTMDWIGEMKGYEHKVYVPAV